MATNKYTATAEREAERNATGGMRDYETNGGRMWRMGVPVATPVRAGDYLRGLSAIVTRREVYRNAFEKDVRDLLGAPFVRGTNSGRAALFLTLLAMKRISSRDEVVIPAFVCPSVGRAVVKAGLKPLLCDVGPVGSGLDVKSLDGVVTRHTLAVVTAHLYGYPCEIRPVLELAHSVGAMVIEDGAQAFGAKLHGRSVGAIGDAGIFSFGMSKVLWSMGGGLIATSNSELGSHVDHVLAPSTQASRFREAMDITKFAALGLLMRSHHLGPLAAVWCGAMRGKHDCDDFEARLFLPSHAAVGRALLPRLTEITRIRRRNAGYFADYLSAFDGLVLPEASPESESVFLRFPIVVKDAGVKKQLLANLRTNGINASEMYTRSSYEALRGFAARDSRCPRTEYLAERMLNLPTHPYMRERDLSDTVSAFDSVLGRKRTTPRSDSAIVAIN